MISGELLWITASKVEAGDRIRPIRNGYIWENRRKAENSREPFALVTEVRREGRKVELQTAGFVYVRPANSKTLVHREAGQ